AGRERLEGGGGEAEGENREGGQQNKRIDRPHDERERDGGDEKASDRRGDAEPHPPVRDSAVDQRTRSAGERSEVPVATVALEVEILVREYGRDLEAKDAEPAQPKRSSVELAPPAIRAGGPHPPGGPRQPVE